MSSTLLALLLLATVPRATDHQNVLILVADDLGVDYVACYAEGPNPAPTPNLDALAQRGVLFRNAWAAPICSASRAQIMTGRYGYRTGIGHVVIDEFALRLEEITLPERIADVPELSIACAAFGKWHLGNEMVGGLSAPNLAGWGHFAGTMENLDPPLEDYSQWTHVENGVASSTTDYPTTRTVEDFLAWHANQSGPWFAYVAFHAPHAPLHAPPAGLHSQSLPPGEPRENPVPFHHAMTEALDAEIGRLLASLGSDLDRTHVIFVSDNGTPSDVSLPPFLPQHAKMTPYEGGLRVPLIIAGPAVPVGGREVRDLVALPDVFETALELAGLVLEDPRTANPPRDGMSLVGTLAPPQNARLPLRATLYQEYFAPSGFDPPVKDFRMARNLRYKLILNTKGPAELFDLLQDPFESVNLLDQPLPPMVSVHHRALLQHIEGRLAGG